MKPGAQILDEPTSYLYDSINTRVPPMNISGKKSPQILSKIQWESPNPLRHSKSHQIFPQEKILIRGKSPQPSYRNYYENEGTPISIQKRPEYNFFDPPKPPHRSDFGFFEPQRQIQLQPQRADFNFFEPPPQIQIQPQPVIRNFRQGAYRPALVNINNKMMYPERIPNLNPFEVCEKLFLEEKTQRNERETKNFEKYEVQSVDKGTDPMKILKEAKVQTYEEEKKPVEIIPTVPNEDKSDPNIKIASYVVSPIQKKSTGKNESFRGRSEHENSEIMKKASQRKNLDEKKKFIKGMIEEIDIFLARQREIDKAREQELNSIMTS